MYCPSQLVRNKSCKCAKMCCNCPCMNEGSYPDAVVFEWTQVVASAGWLIVYSYLLATCFSLQFLFPFQSQNIKY